jgi:hypothetical protein
MEEQHCSERSFGVAHGDGLTERFKSPWAGRNAPSNLRHHYLPCKAGPEHCGFPSRGIAGGVGVVRLLV